MAYAVSVILKDRERLRQEVDFFEMGFENGLNLGSIVLEPLRAVLVPPIKGEWLCHQNSIC